MIYLDHNATTPLLPEVADAMQPWLREHYGNPSSVHRAGRLARQALDTARQQVASLVGSRPEEVIFTSGGTEADNLALTLADQLPGGLITAGTEHAAVLEPAEARRDRGQAAAFLPVDGQGLIAVEDLKVQLDRSGRSLVSLMWANNESGVIQDIEALGSIVRAAGSVMHTDAVQAAGKIALNFATAPVDLISLSAHKIYGPKGIGALICRRDVDLKPMLRGGPHELGRRAGTENLPGIVGFGVAAEAAARDLAERSAHVAALRGRLEQGLQAMPQVTIFAREVPRVANTCQFAVAGFHSEALLMALDRMDIAVASGSACHAGTGKPTHVLLAMGYDEDTAHGAIRISFGRQNTEADVDAFLAALQQALDGLMPAIANGLLG